MSNRVQFDRILKINTGKWKQYCVEYERRLGLRTLTVCVHATDYAKTIQTNVCSSCGLHGCLVGVVVDCWFVCFFWLVMLVVDLVVGSLYCLYLLHSNWLVG